MTSIKIVNFRAVKTMTYDRSENSQSNGSDEIRLSRDTPVSLMTFHKLEKYQTTPTTVCQPVCSSLS